MIGDIIKDLRNAHNLKQNELAEILNISPSTIGMYEQNRRTPDINMITRIAKYFNVSVDYITGESSIKNPYLKLNPITGHPLTNTEIMQYNEVMEHARALFFDESVSDRDKETFYKSIHDAFWEAKELNANNQ